MRNIVIVQPGSEEQVREGEPASEVTSKFMTHSTVQKYKESQCEVSSWGNTALATYHFDIEYKTEGKEYHDTRRDIFGLVRDRGRWLVVWRTVLPLEQKALVFLQLFALTESQS